MLVWTWYKESTPGDQVYLISWWNGGETPIGALPLLNWSYAHEITSLSNYMMISFQRIRPWLKNYDNLQLLIKSHNSMYTTWVLPMKEESPNQKIIILMRYIVL